ncbi:MAG: serine--tRNA ligase, partial [Pseudomonadales bacterium]|nr:serine--tRNA ligase [Pseudomonadales bacterium]
MLDPKLLRNELAEVVQRLTIKNFQFDESAFNNLEGQRKALQVETESLKNERNVRSKSIGKAKAAGEDIAPLLAEVDQFGQRLEEQSSALQLVQTELDHLLMGVPNIPHESVPAGKSEEDNIELRKWGQPKEFDFEVKDHVDAAGSLMDFESAAKIAASRFVVMHGPMARLHRALTQFMLDTHVAEHDYQEVYVPYLVSADSLRGTGQLPKFEE